MTQTQVESFLAGRDCQLSFLARRDVVFGPKRWTNLQKFRFILHYAPRAQHPNRDYKYNCRTRSRLIYYQIFGAIFFGNDKAKNGKTCFFGKLGTISSCAVWCACCWFWLVSLHLGGITSHLSLHFLCPSPPNSFRVSLLFYLESFLILFSCSFCLQQRQNGSSWALEFFHFFANVLPQGSSCPQEQPTLGLLSSSQLLGYQESCRCDSYDESQGSILVSMCGRQQKWL